MLWCRALTNDSVSPCLCLVLQGLLIFLQRMGEVIIADDSDMILLLSITSWTAGPSIGAIADSRSNSNEHNSTTVGDTLAYAFEGQ
jgi:hypothetical protein